MSVSDWPAVSVTVRVKASVPALEGAVNVGCWTAVSDSDTAVPPVWFHEYVRVLPDDAEPSSVTVEPAATVWFTPALAVGGEITVRCASVPVCALYIISNRVATLAGCTPAAPAGIDTVTVELSEAGVTVNAYFAPEPEKLEVVMVPPATVRSLLSKPVTV